MEERLAFSMLNLIGREVRVTKMNGCVLTGVFCASSNPGAPTADDHQQSHTDGFVLRYVHHVGGEKPQTEFGARDRVKLLWDEVESVLAAKAGGPQGWDASPEDVAAQGAGSAVAHASHHNAAKKKVETDQKISLPKKQGAPGEREALQAVPSEWLVAPVPASTSSSSKGNNSNNNNEEAFDQFRVNETKFGVKSTYKEEFYTTELDRDKLTAEQHARAERIAREIENSTSTNSHLLEERGKKPLEDAWDDDEEAKYGAVLGSGGYEKYKPPAKRGPSGQGALKPASSPPPAATTTPSQPSPAAPLTTPPPTSSSPSQPPKAPATSYASMVKGATPQPSPPTSSAKIPPPGIAPATSLPPPLQVKKASPAAGPVTAPTATATLGKKASDKSVVIAAPPVDPKKKREDEIREFKEFSKSYTSPSSKPSKSRTSPPSMNLESPSRKTEQPQTPTKEEAKPVVEGTKPAATEAKSEAPAVVDAAPADDVKKAASATTAPASTTSSKLKLNPNAKNFNPSAAAFVPAAPAAFPMPQPTVVMVPQPGAPVMAAGARPRYVPMPPPPVIPFQPGAAPMYQAGPPMGGYMMPMQVPYGAGGRPMVYYPAPPPQMYPQQMLIPVPYPPAAGGSLPPPPMPMMPPLPPPASPQQQQGRQAPPVAPVGVNTAALAPAASAVTPAAPPPAPTASS